MSEIKLKVLPVIEHDLVKVGNLVDKRLAQLNVANLVATDETIQSLKTLRADLNKELKEYEEQRKVVKDLITKPYAEMETVYKQMVSDKYKEATDILKDKIGEFENLVKTNKRNEVEEYFNEAVSMFDVEWLTFEMLKMDINLSTSVKKYKEEVAEAIKKVVGDVELIEMQQYAMEMMVEYKKDLNISRSIKEVADRKERERKEIQARIDAEIERREKILTHSCNMIRRDFVKSYVNVIHDELFVSYDTIRNATKEEFEKVVQDAIREMNARRNEKESASAPLKAPVVVTNITIANTTVGPEIITIQFEVAGTYEQLVSLNNYLKRSGLQYEQL